MATHPVEPGALPGEQAPANPNPTHLPVEPDLGPVPAPVEPEDPRVRPPVL
ncbi:MAG: stereocilin [Ramlibacter sp.]